MEKPRKKYQLRSIEHINSAIEDLFNMTVNGDIEPKRADAANTQIRAIYHMNVEIPLKYNMIAIKNRGKLPIPIPWIEDTINRAFEKRER